MSPSSSSSSGPAFEAVLSNMLPRFLLLGSAMSDKYAQRLFDALAELPELWVTTVFCQNKEAFASACFKDLSIYPVTSLALSNVAFT